MEWYEELDFDENPFEMDSKFIGNEETLEELFYTIMSGNILIVEGQKGEGKTRLMKEVIRKFGGKGKIAYIDCKSLDRELNVEGLILKKKGWFRKNPKNMILLLDNVNHITEKNMERIKYYFDQNYIRAAILATDDKENLNLSPSLKQRVWKHITMHPLTDYEAVQVIREKLGSDTMSDRIIKEVFKESEKNMKKFMENTELVCRAYIENKEIKEEDVKRILESGKKWTHYGLGN